MVRTAQTAGLSERDIYHIQNFVDHAGQPATRIRHSSRNEPIPTDYHAQPVFTFQVYTTFSLDLDERPAKRGFNAFDAERTILTDLIDYVGSLVAGNAQRPEPLWELYTDQQGAFECVEHQRREIAHRKSKRDDKSIPPIPQVVESLASDDKTGFIIVIDSDNFKVGQNGAQGPLWVHFERRFPSKISWEPRLRLDDDPDIPDNGIFGSLQALKILPERVDAMFLRIQRVEEMHSSLGMMYFSSCLPSDPPSSVQDTMDIRWDEDEGTPDDECANHTEDAITTLQIAAARLSFENFDIRRQAETHITISNVPETSEPDLRYVVLVPFLDQPGLGSNSEEVATAFTHEITSRLSEKKTISFEFCKPPFKTLWSQLASYRTREYPDDYIGALTTFSNDKSGREDATTVRAYPIARTELAQDNDPERILFEPYRTFLVVLDRPNFSQDKGGVLFLLADGGKSKPDANQDEAPSMKAEHQDYFEMSVWRCAGMDEVARRLQMVWGGVEWEQRKEDQNQD
ncbi:hypothetical protein BDV97DRAFT_342474 [Delphinella strobiligena]|nr:hypothetical protein BDV97DRAFT_342474 [Delphinella strobiligena]